MPEFHPSISAVGRDLDERTAALAQRYYEEEGRPEGRALDHWLRAERETQGASSHRAPSEPPPVTIKDAMQLGQ